MYRYLLVYCLLGMVVTRCPAQNQELPLREVTLVPEGRAELVREGNLQFSNRRAVMPQVQRAIPGTLLLSAAANFRLLKTEYGRDTVYERREAVSFFEVLKANVGAMALVTYQIGNEIEDVRGTILAFQEGSRLVRLRQPTGATTFVSEEQIRQVAVEGEPRTAYWEPRIGPAVIVEIDKPLTTAPVRLTYQSEGYTWSPSYRLQLQPDSSIRLQLKVQLQNGAENLQGVRLRIQPRLPGELLTPEPEPEPQPDTLGVDSATADSNRVPLLRQPVNPAERLPTFYELGTVSLAAGSASELELRERKVKATYTTFADLPLLVNDQGLLSGQESQPYTPRLQAAVENSTELPLQAGPLTVLNEQEELLARTELPNLRPGDTALVTLSPIPDIAVLLSERQHERQSRVRRENLPGSWDIITVRGIIRVKNHSDRVREAVVRHAVVGEIRRSSTGRIHDTPGIVQGNPVRTLTWRIPLAPGMVQQYPFEYVYYLRVQ